jgi:hypothetical protein
MIFHSTALYRSAWSRCEVSVWPGPVNGVTRECDDGLFVAITAATVREEQDGRDGGKRGGSAVRRARQADSPAVEGGR